MVMCEIWTFMLPLIYMSSSCLGGHEHERIIGTGRNGGKRGGEGRSYIPLDDIIVAELLVTVVGVAIIHADTIGFVNPIPRQYDTYRDSMLARAAGALSEGQYEATHSGAHIATRSTSVAAVAQ
jgi:hypothetical protein